MASELERVREEILALARSESRTDEQRESIRKALCADPFATHKDIAEAAGLDDVFASEVSRMKRRLTNGGQVLTDAKASSYYKTRPPLEHVKEYQAAVERSTKHGTLQQRDFIRNMGVEHGAREMILCSSNELRELIAEAVKQGYQRIGGE